MSEVILGVKSCSTEFDDIGKILKNNVFNVNKSSYWKGFIDNYGNTVQNVFLLYNEVFLPLSDDGDQISYNSNQINYDRNLNKLIFNFNSYYYQILNKKLEISLEFSIELFLTFSKSYPEIIFELLEEGYHYKYFYIFKKGKILSTKIFINDEEIENSEITYSQKILSSLEIDKPGLIFLSSCYHFFSKLPTNLENKYNTLSILDKNYHLFYSHSYDGGFLENKHILFNVSNGKFSELKKERNLMSFINKLKEDIKFSINDISINFFRLALDEKRLHDYIYLYKINKNNLINKEIEDIIQEYKINLVIFSLKEILLEINDIKDLQKSFTNFKKISLRFNVKIIVVSDSRRRDGNEFFYKKEQLEEELLSNNLDMVIYNSSDYEYPITILKKDNDRVMVEFI